MRRQTTGWILVVIQFALILAVIVVPRRDDPGVTWIVIGAVIAVVGAGITIASMLSLGSALRPNPVPAPDAGLRTNGLYRVVRHPIYAGVVLMAIGYTVAVGSWWQAFMTLLLAEFLNIKSTWEDSLLAETYGDAWVEWARQTPGGFIPRKAR